MMYVDFSHLYLHPICEIAVVVLTLVEYIGAALSWHLWHIHQLNWDYNTRIFIVQM